MQSLYCTCFVRKIYFTCIEIYVCALDIVYNAILEKAIFSLLMLGSNI